MFIDRRVSSRSFKNVHYLLHYTTQGKTFEHLSRFSLLTPDYK